jgi:hypothetical protein
VFLAVAALVASLDRTAAAFAQNAPFVEPWASSVPGASGEPGASSVPGASGEAGTSSVSGASSNVPGAPEPFRLNYEAPAECPSREAFLTQVRARVGSDWEAPPGLLARAIEVRVASDGVHSVARIDYVDESGKAVSRAVAAVTCEEVVTGIALVTALAIESRFPRREPESEIPPALPSPPPVLLAPPRLVRVVLPAPPPAPAPHFDVGAGFLGTFGLGGAMGLGARAFFGAGWERGPDFRLGIDVARAPKFDVDGTDNRLSLYAGRASVCPFALGNRWVRALPCAGVEAGVLHAESFTSAAIQGASGNAAFASPFASLRADAVLDAVFVELEAEGRFSVDGHRFTYANPPKPVYREPFLAFGFSAAVGLRL